MTSDPRKLAKTDGGAVRARRQRGAVLTAEARSFAISLKEHRAVRQLSLQDLALRAGVSKSMISKLERSEVQPSLDVAVRLATALNMTLAEMLTADRYQSVCRIGRDDQLVISEPKAGWERRVLSPAFTAKNAEVTWDRLSGGCAVGEAVTHPKGAQEYIVVIKGPLRLYVDGHGHLLETGDGFFFEADRPHRLENPGQGDAEFIIMIKLSA